MFSSRELVILVLCLSCYALAEDENKKEEEVLKYTRPSVDDAAYFSEPFHSKEEFESRWILSEAKKEGVDDSIAKYDGKWDVKEPKDNSMKGDNGLIFMSEAKHGAISAPLKTPFKFEDKPLIVQYEVRFQNKQECGGAYVKLLADKPDFSSKEFGDKTEYTIMFGPDKCGGDGKLHFIFQHKNPITHKMEEKHAKKGSGDFNHVFDDGKTHLFGLLVRPDNTFEIQVDKVVVNSGSLLTNMEPAVNPPKIIDDPEDIKPEEWDEREKIVDATATKPDDWDEDAPQMITDPNASKPDGWLDDEPELAADPAAVKPEDWDEEEDGEWEAPQIPNPKCKAVGCGEWKAPQIKNPQYKGKWTAPLINNPDYKGIWKPKQIDNPNYFEDNNPFTMTPIAAVGFELWSMQSNIAFDNIIVADDLSLVNQWTLQTWDLKHATEGKGDGSAAGMWNSFMQATTEKPWLWVIVALVALMPILLIYFLCFSGKKDTPAVYKKTDEPQPDDESVEDVTPESVEDPEVEKSDEGDQSGSIEEVVDDVAEKIEEVVDDVTPKIEEIVDDAEDKIEEVVDEVVDKIEEKTKDKKESVEEKDSVPKEAESTPAEVTDTQKDDISAVEDLTEPDVHSVPAKVESKSEGEHVPADEVPAEGDKRDLIENSEQIPHASPKTRAAKRRTRKET